MHSSSECTAGPMCTIAHDHATQRAEVQSGPGYRTGVRKPGPLCENPIKSFRTVLFFAQGCHSPTLCVSPALCHRPNSYGTHHPKLFSNEFFGLADVLPHALRRLFCPFLSDAMNKSRAIVIGRYGMTRESLRLRFPDPTTNRGGRTKRVRGVINCAFSLRSFEVFQLDLIISRVTPLGTELEV